jgi:hypothetical protein
MDRRREGTQPHQQGDPRSADLLQQLRQENTRFTGGYQPSGTQGDSTPITDTDYFQHLQQGQTEGPSYQQQMQREIPDERIDPELRTLSSHGDAPSSSFGSSSLSDIADPQNLASPQRGYGNFGDQSTSPQGYGQGFDSHIAGSPTQDYESSHSEIAAGRGFDLEDIAEAYMLAGGHKELPLDYQKEIAQHPFAEQELATLRTYFQSAVDDDRIFTDEKTRLSKIVQQQSAKGKATKARYNQSAAGKATKVQYEQSAETKVKRARYNQSAAGKARSTLYEQKKEGKAKRAQYHQSAEGKAINAQYEKSAAGKERKARYEQKKTDAAILNIPGTEILDEENFG